MTLLWALTMGFSIAKTIILHRGVGTSQGVELVLEDCRKAARLRHVDYKGAIQKWTFADGSFITQCLKTGAFKVGYR